MSNPTTPFSWQMPTATDLVTDLPADFEVFGQAVATSMADLLGGTTGQVLSKNSNTDMDFVWVTSDDANAIQNTIVDAKGDLIAASAADTPARLAVGANGETLVADSSTSTGLRYTSATGQNPVLNSAMQVWQRGTSIAVTGNVGYTADRWQIYAPGATTTTRQTTSDTTNLPNIQYCQRVQRNVSETNTSSMYTSQSFETINSIAYAGKTVTLSFYARKGANFSAASSIMTAALASGTGTDQNITGTYTGVATPISSGVTLTTTWQRFTASGTISTSATEIALTFGFVPVGTAGAADYFEITGVQIDIGSVALPYRTYAGTIQGELAACQRYYQRISGSTDIVGSGQWMTTTTALIVVPNKVTMRTAPTISGTATNLNVTNVTGGAVGATAIAGTVTGVSNQLITITTAGSGVAGNATTSFTNGASGILEMSSEL